MIGPPVCRQLAGDLGDVTAAAARRPVQRNHASVLPARLVDARHSQIFAARARSCSRTSRAASITAMPVA